MHTAAFCIALHGFALLTTTISPVTSTGIADFLDLKGIDDEKSFPTAPEHALVTHSLREALEDNNVETLCYVEYKVTKRDAGRCIKLGRGIRACASDDYLDPFHPDCM